MKHFYKTRLFSIFVFITVSLSPSFYSTAAGAAEQIPTPPKSAEPTTSLDKDTLERELQEYATLYKYGDYDEIIARASAYLGDPYDPDAQNAQEEETTTPKPDGRLYLWRGAAAFSIGQYDLAESDLKQAKNLPQSGANAKDMKNAPASQKSVPANGVISSRKVYAFQGKVFNSQQELQNYLNKQPFKPKGYSPANKSTHGLPSATKLLNEIAQKKKLRPSKTYEVKNGDQVVFRVYYEQDDPVTKALINTLYPAYVINDRIMQTNLTEIPIYIFNDRGSLAKYMKSSFISWAFAQGGRDGMYFCLQGPDGKPINNTSEAYFRGSIAHELNHVILKRAMGNVTLPSWFVEGLAEVASNLLLRENKERNNYNLALSFAAGAIIPPQLLENNKSFYKITETTVKQREKATQVGLRAITADPYAQSTNMVRYLLSNMPPDALPDFLNTVRNQRNFEKAFEEYFNATLPEFYGSWLQEAKANFSSGNYTDN